MLGSEIRDMLFEDKSKDKSDKVGELNLTLKSPPRTMLQSLGHFDRAIFRSEKISSDKRKV